MFSVDHESSVTLYEQLMSQFREKVAAGDLIAGTKLPTVRALATELSVAPYTVARVYRALEADGFVETRGRNGTFVAATGSDQAMEAALATAAYAKRLRELGIGIEEAVSLVRRALS